MTKEELYSKLMFDKEFNNLSPVTKEKLFNAYIKPHLKNDSERLISMKYDDEILLRKTIGEQQKEIERLKTDVQTWKAICESYEAKYYDDRRGIVDLKKEIDTLNTDYSEEVKRLNKIIDALHLINMPDPETPKTQNKYTL